MPVCATEGLVRDRAYTRKTLICAVSQCVLTLTALDPGLANHSLLVVDTANSEGFLLIEKAPFANMEYPSTSWKQWSRRPSLPKALQQI